MIGFFSFIWKFITNLLLYYSKKPSKIHGAIGGGIAGLSILFEKRSTRIVLSQQFFVRSMQASYNILKSRQLFSFSHGDSLLFCLSCASIMYAYVMQPDTIPSACNFLILIKI